MILEGCGNETTNRLIGWTGKVLAEQAEQRHEIAENRALVPKAIGRIALDEILNRFRDWEVDWSRAKLSPTSTVRGWETLPVFVR